MAPLNHGPTERRVTAERAMLAALDGSCHTPIAGLAVLDAGDRMTLRGLVARPDGSEVHSRTASAAVSEAEALGTELGRELRALMPAGFFD